MITIFSGQNRWPALIDAIPPDDAPDHKITWMPADSIRKTCEGALKDEETVMLILLDYPENAGIKKDAHYDNLNEQLNRFAKKDEQGQFQDIPENMMIIREFQYTEDEEKLKELADFIRDTEKRIYALTAITEKMMKYGKLESRNGHVLCSMEKAEDGKKKTVSTEEYLEKFAWSCIFRPENMYMLMMDALPYYE